MDDLQTVIPSTSQALQENPAPSLPPSLQWAPLTTARPARLVLGALERVRLSVSQHDQKLGAAGAYTWPTIMRIRVGGESQIECSNKTQKLGKKEPKESVS